MYILTNIINSRFFFLQRILKAPLQYLVLSACFFLGACSHFEHHHDDGAMINNHSDSNPTIDKTLTINLNGDNKWLMDAHTRSVTSDMVNRFSSLDIEQQDQEALIQLGEQLSLDLDNLIQGCTMKGDEHNALHEFLISFMPALEKLKSSGSMDSAKHVENLLTEYQEYFE
tara:strand:+ start:50071 stop:50583 length:513 start_codon:yes stop_codon:yes gene_type:complete